MAHVTSRCSQAERSVSYSHRWPSVSRPLYPLLPHTKAEPMWLVYAVWSHPRRERREQGHTHKRNEKIITKRTTLFCFGGSFCIVWRRAAHTLRGRSQLALASVPPLCVCARSLQSYSYTCTCSPCSPLLKAGCCSVVLLLDVHCKQLHHGKT